jgi:ABC-type uncharacterized transport system permease subunit
LAYLEKDTNEDHIDGHIMTDHNNHYGHFPKLAVMACLNIAINMVFMVFYTKNMKNAKTTSENMQIVKSYGQNKFFTKIMSISLLICL